MILNANVKMKLMKIVLISIISISCFHYICCVKKENSLWKGFISYKKGVPIVHNPKEPINKEEKIKFIEDLSIGVPFGDENYMFYGLADIEVDIEDNIYALDKNECSIKVFSKEGKFIRKFGRKGQGPGEFDSPLGMGLLKDGNLVILNKNNMQLIYFKINGEYLENKRLPFIHGLFTIDINQDGAIYGVDILFIDSRPNVRLLKIVPPYENINVLASFPTDGKIPIDKIVFSKNQKGNIVWAFSPEYTLHILDADGKEIRRIIKKYDEIHISDFIKGRMDKSSFDISVCKEILPPIINIIFDEDENLFVRTHEKNENNYPIYEIFDCNGRFIEKNMMPFRPILFNRNSLYTISTDEDGYYFIKRYNVNWHR